MPKGELLLTYTIINVKYKTSILVRFDMICNSQKLEELCKRWSVFTVFGESVENWSIALQYCEKVFNEFGFTFGAPANVLYTQKLYSYIIKKRKKEEKEKKRKKEKRKDSECTTRCIFLRQHKDQFQVDFFFFF